MAKTTNGTKLPRNPHIWALNGRKNKEIIRRDRRAKDARKGWRREHEV